MEVDIGMWLTIIGLALIVPGILSIIIGAVAEVPLKGWPILSAIIGLLLLVVLMVLLMQTPGRDKMQFPPDVFNHIVLVFK